MVKKGDWPEITNPPPLLFVVTCNMLEMGSWYFIASRNNTLDRTIILNIFIFKISLMIKKGDWPAITPPPLLFVVICNMPEMGSWEVNFTPFCLSVKLLD